MNKSNGLECLAWTWGIGAVVGCFVTAVLWGLFDWTFTQGAFMGILCFVFLGAVLTLMMCRASSGPVAAGSAGVNGTTSAASSSAAADTSAADSAAAAAAAKAQADADAAAAKAKADADAAAAKADADAAAKAEADAAAAAAQADADAAAQAEADAAAQAQADADAAAAQAEADAEAARVAAAAEADAEAARAAAAATPAGEDYDGDGVIEGTDEGTRPEALDGPRGGVADDLKRIKGIGPKMEKLCNSLGFYHFDQIASWSPDEVAWVNANLEGFKGRVTRDTWVEQAGLLASGAETEFSKKVDDGDVY